MLEIRAVKDDLELNEVFRVLDRAFRRTKADYFIRRTTIGKPDYDYWHTRVLVLDGKVVSTIEIFPTFMWLEGRKIKNAGIGSVATDPDFQGRGLGIKIVKDTNNFVKNKGFTVATLFTSIFDFYAKAGYFKVTYPFYEIGRVYSLPAGKKVITFRPIYIERIVRIHEEYNRPLVGPVVKDCESYMRSFGFLNEDTWLFMLAHDGSDITGFIRAREFKNTLEVLEFASVTPDEDLALFTENLRERGERKRIFINLSDYEKERITRVELKSRGQYSMMFAILDDKFISKDEFIEKFRMRGNFWLADLY